MSVAIDIASHWIHTQVTLMSGKTSHKSIDLNENPILRLYYTNRPILFSMCFANEVFYVSLYMLYFYEGPLGKCKLFFAHFSFYIIVILINLVCIWFNFNLTAFCGWLCHIPNLLISIIHCMPSFYFYHLFIVVVWSNLCFFDFVSVGFRGIISSPHIHLWSTCSSQSNDQLD